MYLVDFSASSEAVFQVQLSTIPERSVTTLDADGNVAGGKVKLSLNKPTDVSVRHKALCRLSTSAIVTSRKLISRLSIH